MLSKILVLGRITRKQTLLWSIPGGRSMEVALGGFASRARGGLVGVGFQQAGAPACEQHHVLLALWQMAGTVSLTHIVTG